MKIPADVAEILRSRVAITGNQLVITGPRLDPLMYRLVNKTLTMLGGKWTGGKTQAHVFPDSPKDVIAAALGDGKVLDRKQTFQFFETPTDLAARMVSLAEIRPGMSILEPSAGRGAIARVIRDSMPERCRLICIELDPANVDVLERDGFDPSRADFLVGAYAPFDRILMNPPFTRGQDVDHVLHAYEHLSDGGRLVAIMSTSSFANSDRRSVDFRDWLKYVDCPLLEDLPAGTFKNSGTTVATKLVVISR